MKKKPLLTISTSEGRNTFLKGGNSSLRGCPMTERQSLRKIKYNKISIRKNLIPLFDKRKTRNIVYNTMKNTIDSNRTIKNSIENSKSIVYYETQNYNIPLVHTLINEK